DLAKPRKASKEVRQYSCEIYQKNLSERCNLKTHIRIHSDERPFSCKVCRKCFNQGNHLTAHMIIQRGESGLSLAKRVAEALVKVVTWKIT
uniref:C2H2-type domain-containing protein n=1 Tax=Oryzias latipes TaxID=8090 RepID=A0A3B3IMB4_ORYLA